MSGSVSVCSIDPALKASLREFRFRRATNAKAIVMKIDTATHTLVEDEVMEDVTAEELRDALPEHQPRFAIYSFKLDHGDAGRVSFPMCLLFSTPRDCKTELQVMYAGTKLSLVREAELTKVFEVRDLEELTDEWLEAKLKR